MSQPFGIDWWRSVIPQGPHAAPDIAPRPVLDLANNAEATLIMQATEAHTGVSVHTMMRTSRRKGPEYNARQVAILAMWLHFDNAAAIMRFFERGRCTVWRTIDEGTEQNYAAARAVLAALSLERRAA